MILGTVSLFQKRGAFYKDQLHICDDTFTTTIKKEVAMDIGLGVFDAPHTHQITPVDENGNTDYIDVLYQDNGQAVTYPYEVTVWVLIEEEPEITN